MKTKPKSERLLGGWWNHYGHYTDAYGIPTHEPGAGHGRGRYGQELNTYGAGYGGVAAMHPSVRPEVIDEDED